MDFFPWLQDALDPAKWSVVAQQMEVILAALDDLDIAREFRTVCRAYDSRSERDADCDGGFISEEALLWVQVANTQWLHYLRRPTTNVLTAYGYVCAHRCISTWHATP